jgi:anti-sigma B factor antagonist
MSLDVSIKNVGEKAAVVTLTGALSLGTGLKIADTQIQRLIESGVSKVVLDLTGVPYSDSAGLGTIVHVYGLAQDRGGMVRLCGVSERIMAMLKMTRTDSLLPVDADLETSLAALQE